MSDSQHSLRRIYAEICRGYSLADYREARVYVKHLTIFDQTEIDSLREYAFEDAKRMGIKTEADKRIWLEKQGLWSKKEDFELNRHQSYLENLEKTRRTLTYKSQMDQMKKQIAEAQIKVDGMVSRCSKLIGLTAEQVADRKVQHEYVRLAFFSDEALTKSLFGNAEMAELGDDDIDILLFTYIGVINQFGADVLRQIVIRSFFTNHFYLCGDHIHTFFGKAIVNLTIYQTNLLSYGQYFKSLMTQNDIPKEYSNTPDRIEEYILRSRNMKTAADKMAKNADRVGLVGGTREDIRAMGAEDGSDKVYADINRGVKSGMDAAKGREITYTTPRR